VFQRLPGTQMPSARPRKTGGQWTREKITELFGPSIPKVFANPRILRALQARAIRDLAKNLAHEVTYLLGRQGA
jgi:hypothetical protein